jgi:hypothetical protein
VLVRTGDELIDALRQGQGVLAVLPLGSVKDELDAKIVELRPTTVDVPDHVSGDHGATAPDHIAL